MNLALIKPMVELMQAGKEWERTKDAITEKERKKPTSWQTPMKNKDPKEEITSDMLLVDCF